MKDQRLTELSHFLKSRRARIKPAQVGLPDTSRRRTPGLKREELAQLAGISVTWYTWLEQGRDIQVSLPVIDSLCRVLKLDDDECAYLKQLAQVQHSNSYALNDVVSKELQSVLDNLMHCPSTIINEKWQVLSWNDAACLLFGDFSKMKSLERNILWSIFTDPQQKNHLLNWPAHAKALLGRFRIAYSNHLDDPWFIDFVELLKSKSPEFSTWWALHDIESSGLTKKSFHHPTLGILDFMVSKFEVLGHNNLKLIVHTPTMETLHKLK